MDLLKQRIVGPIKSIWEALCRISSSKRISHGIKWLFIHLHVSHRFRARADLHKPNIQRLWWERNIEFRHVDNMIWCYSTISLGSRNVKINRLSILPMPVNHPGPAYVSLNIDVIAPIVGVIKVSVNITRTVSKIKLPVRCYIIDGKPFGSWLVLPHLPGWVV